MKPEFTTDNLWVYKAIVKPTPHNTRRMIFLAFVSDEDLPRIAVSAMVNFPIKPQGERFPEGFPPYLDWIETGVTHRRQGLASELWSGIEKHLGEPLFATGASHAGKALCRKMSRITDSGRKMIGSDK